MLEADEAADIEEVQAWAAGLDALHARIAGELHVNAPDRVALVDQVASQVMTDEATGPGDQDGWLLGH